MDLLRSLLNQDELVPSMLWLKERSCQLVSSTPYSSVLKKPIEAQVLPGIFCEGSKIGML